MRKDMRQALVLIAVVMLAMVHVVAAELPDPDGKPADMAKPVQVFILMGQSNMLGFGRVSGEGEGSLEHAIKQKGKYPYLVDAEGNWTVRPDVRHVQVGAKRGGNRNEWMTIKSGKIGPEMGIGHYLGHALDAPVMILKSCTGNRSLAWDLLPPGSERFEKDGTIYAGYKDSPSSWAKGTEPEKINWYAGLQYDGDTKRAKQVLAALDTYYPGAKGYEVAGFFWWQGDKDRYRKAHAERYEINLVNLIKSLRKDFDAPNAKFVCATLGQTKKDAALTNDRRKNEKLIMDAMFAVDGKSGKYPEFKGNVAAVYTHPFSYGGSSNGHYGQNAETYMDVGEAMGKAMLELLAK